MNSLSLKYCYDTRFNFFFCAVHRVENIVGPQTQPFDACNSFDGPELRPAIANCPPGAEERLKNAEHYLGINKSSLDVFQRLKAIEDKILYLESVSPEYFDFVVRAEVYYAVFTKVL